MKKSISVRVNGKEYEIPNSWDLLTSDQYLKLIELVSLMESGQYSLGVVKCLFLCCLMKWDVRKVGSYEPNRENFVSIASQISFFYKEKEDMFVLDLCFCRQMLPIIFIGKKAYYGYEVSTDYNSLTCSLSALQYIEARQLLDMGEESLPLLAAVLYFRKGEYSSEKAQKLAGEFKKLPANTLRAIVLNFTAVNNFIFQKTEFSLLTKFVPQKGNAITTDATDALYDLAKDGLGNASQVERMNMLTYLRILRKKTIDGVKTLKTAGMDVAKIANEVGLPLEIVKKII